MAHLHLVTNEAAARRVAQLGEPEERIHVVGSPGLDLIRKTARPSREDFFRSVGLEAKARNILVTFHPVTLAADSEAQLAELLAALQMLGEDVTLLFTGSNADPEARALDRRVQEFVDRHGSAAFVPSLGAERYFAALQYMDAVAGNSSSGLYEAPSFGIPTVNVGDRQRGRLRAHSVIDCAAERGAIHAALTQARARGRTSVTNPYGDGHASERIVEALKSIAEPRALLRKSFVDCAA
jgi:UDP-hydrolysing UDP-N-acetyl-D-glucosamine 2-epimerase